MIVVSLAGGLGNQLFQYAHARTLSSRYSIPIFLDKRLLDPSVSNRPYSLDLFDLKGPFTTEEQVLQVLGRNPVIKELSENSYNFSPAYLSPLDPAENPPDLLVISGYWQTEKYFREIEQSLRQELVFRDKCSGKWLSLQQQIEQEHAVMVNVRRTDYLQKLDYHGVVSPSYLQTAIKYIREKVESPVFYVFSDDIPWCREHIPAAADIRFVGEEYYDDRYNYYLQLMISCKDFILANSTFCWWAAWLATNKDKTIIAPKNWFATAELNSHDLIPESWIQL